MHIARTRWATLVLGLLYGPWAPSLGAQNPARTLTEMALSLSGVSATLQDAAPVVPKGLPTSVRVVVQAGGRQLTPDEVRRFLGNQDFQLQAEISGPGLLGALSLPQQAPDVPVVFNSLVLPLPSIPIAGDYDLGNLRVVVGGHVALDVEPQHIVVKVIDQILVTSVTTRPLTLDEIRAHGIVLDRDDYQGFEFNLALRIDSEVVPLHFPVVFDRQGVQVPLDLIPPGPPGRENLKLPYMKPVLLKIKPGPNDQPGSGPVPPDMSVGGNPVTIPGLLVIPGNVGYLKQFFSAKLFVANGAPGGSGLSVRDIKALIKLPPGDDGVAGTTDDPLALPELLRDGSVILQPTTMNVVAVGGDGQPGTGDDESVLGPSEQGQAEFLLRGEREGYHQIDFDISAVLDGLRSPDGVMRPIDIVGSAGGGVLVRNPYFDLTFTVPTVVRVDEPFKVFITVTNIGQGAANLFTLQLDAGALSNTVQLLDPSPVREVETLKPGDSTTFEYNFRSDATGQVIAKYLKLSGSDATGSHGKLRFTLGVGERGVPLSPDTLQLPSAVSALPSDVVRTAMRVLGQAWSVANAPLGSLPSGVRRIDERVVIAKALSLAEAGLRVSLGQPRQDALRDLVFDLYRMEQVSPEQPVDQGFDQLLRETEAGRNFAQTLGLNLSPSVDAAGSIAAYEWALAEVGFSGPDMLSFSVDTGPTRLADVALVDAFGATTSVTTDASTPISQVASAVLVPAGAPDTGHILGFVSRPSGSYVLELVGRAEGSASLSLSLPSGDGETYRHLVLSGITLHPGSRSMIAFDLQQPDRVLYSQDLDANGVADGPPNEYAPGTFSSSGPRLVAASVIGPETFSLASEFGVHAAVLFDRIVSESAANDPANYSLPNNWARYARRQLSGRLVFLALGLPEGPYEPQTLSVAGMADMRQHAGPSGSVPLTSRLNATGGVVTGHVLHADGTPVNQGQLYYINTISGSEFCQEPPHQGTTHVNNTAGIAVTELSSSGGFALHYVRQNPDGCPFYVITQDPLSGAQRYSSARVRGAGDRLTLDIVLLGNGAVEGFVRNRVSGQPEAGAMVVARSNEDAQSGGQALTDAFGHYAISGITVGAVTVHAAKGIGTGFAAGRIYNSGSSARVDVELDEGALNISGKVTKLENGVGSEAGGALVYLMYGSAVVGWQFTDAHGRYTLRGMPAGTFTAFARFEDLFARHEGFAIANQNIADLNLVVQVPPDQVTHDIVGHVLMADGTPVDGAFVSITGVNAFLPSVATDTQGFFRVPDVPVPTYNVNYSAYATSQDGTRTGATPVQITASAQFPADARITLSGRGNATFTVLGPDNRPVPGIAVGLSGVCANPCGCASRTSNSQGQVTFENQPLGQVFVQAFWPRTAYTDFATAKAVVPGDAQTGFGILRFGGVGSVNVKVVDADQEPVGASMVTLSTQTFQYDPYQALCGLAPHSVSLQTSITSATPGEVKFTNVLVAAGKYGLQATNPNAPGVVARDGGTLTQSGQANSHLLTVREFMAGKLSGTVYLPDGAPAGPGVVVTVSGLVPDYSVETDVDGKYHFAPILPASSYTLVARDPELTRGLGVVRDQVVLPVGQDRTFDLHLKGRGAVNVRVIDGNGDAVPSAQVTLKETNFPEGTYQRALTPSNQGVVNFPAVYEGPLSVEIKDSYGRGGRASGILPGPGQTIEIKVRVTPTGCITGRFVMPAPGGQPIPYGVVKLIGPPSQQVIGQATTGSAGPDAGHFDFDYVPLGNVRIEAQDPLTARHGIAAATLQIEGHLDDDAVQCLVLDVHAEALGIVAGLVTSNGAAQPGVEVELVSGNYRARTISNEDGTYRVEGVPAGQIVATARPAGGYLTGSASGTLHAEGDTLALDVALRDSVVVNGHLHPASGEDAPPISQISLTNPAFTSNALQVFSEADGSFHFERAPVGNAVFDARMLQGIDRGRTSLTLERADPQLPVEVDVQMNGVGHLLGRALDASGGAVTNGYVFIECSGAFACAYALTLPSSGEFVVSDLLAGPISIKMWTRTPTGTFLYGNTTAQVNPGETADVVVKLEETGTVQGRVLRSDGQTPAYGAEVSLTLNSPSRGYVSLGTVPADANGRFVLTGVPFGQFSGQVRDGVTGGIAMLPQGVMAHNGDTFDYHDIVLDDSAPVLSFVTPAEGSAQASLAGPLALNASDTQGLDLSTFRVTYANLGVQTESAFTVANGVLTGSLIPSNLTVGSNRLRASVRDLAGNLAAAEVSFVVVGATITGHVEQPGNAGPAQATPVQVDNMPERLTDANGNFTQGGLRPGQHTLRATDLGTQLSVTQTVSVTDGGTSAATLTLPSFGLLSVHVTRPSGVAAAAVTVTAGGHSASTGDDGRASLGALPLGTYTLNATLPNGDLGQGTAVLQALGTAVTAEISLNGIGSATVTVRDAQAQLVSGAHVTLTSSSPFGGSYSATTGADGSVSFPSVLVGTLTALADAQGRTGQVTQLLQDGGHAVLTVALEAAGRIVGTVRHANGGAPASEASVTLSGPRSQTDPAADGTFAFENVRLGSFTLDATTADGDHGRISGILSQPGATVTKDIALVGLGKVEVTVRNAAGAVPGAAVTVTSTQPFASPKTLTTGVDGVASFNQVFAGQIDVSAQVGSTGAQRTLTLSPGETLPVVLTLESVAVFDGTVFAPGGTSPVPGAHVRVSGIASDFVTAADGRFRFENLALRAYDVRVYVDNRLRTLPQTVTLTNANETVTADLTLVGLGRVTGTVRRQGTPVAGASVALQSQSPIGGSFSGLTTGQGTYVFDGVPVGGFTVNASSGVDSGEVTGSVPPATPSVTADINLVLAAVNLPVTLVDGNAVNWQVRADGSLYHGTMFQGGTPRLAVVSGGAAHVFANDTAAQASSAQNKREIVLSQTDLAGLHATRKVFVPVDGYFVRYLDVLENHGSGDVIVDVLEELQLDGSPRLVASASGGAELGPQDAWVTLDDADTSDVYTSGSQNYNAFAPFAAAVSGAGGIMPSTATFTVAGTLGTTSYRWNAVTIPAGGSVAFLQLLSAQADRARAQATAERLAQLPPEALVGLTSSEAQAVRNFHVPSDLASGVLPLPANDGEVSGRVLAFDGSTLVKQGAVTLRSLSPLYGRPLQTTVSSVTSGFSFQGSPSSGVVVPRAGFDLRADIFTLDRPSATAAGDLAGAPSLEQDILFTGTGLVSGRVLRSDAATPIASALVTLSGAGGQLSSSSSIDGTFTFPVVSPGTVSLVAQHPLGSPTVTAGSVPVTANTRTSRDLAFPALGKLTVLLRTAVNGLAAGSVTLTGAVTRTVSVGASGQATLEDLPAGPYTLTAYDPRSRGVATHQIVIAADIANPDEVVAFPPVGSVSLTVSVGSNRLSGASVYYQAVSAGSGLYFGGSTSGAGTLTITNLPGEQVTVRVVHPQSQYQSAEQSFTITTEAQNVSLTFDLPGVANVAGVMRSRDGLALSGQVFAFSGDAQSYGIVSTGSTGAFTFANLPVGPLLLRGYFASSSDFIAGQAEVSGTIAADSLPLNLDALAPVGRLAAPGDIELWTFDAQASTSTTVQVGGLAYGSNAALGSPTLEVRRPDGTLLVTTTSSTTFVAPVSGTYVAVVRAGASGPSSGGYHLGRDSVIFRPLAAARVAGHVLRGPSAAPVVGQTVRLKLGAALMATHVTEASGFRFDLVPGLTYTLEAVEPDGIVSGSRTVTAPASGQELTADLGVPARGNIQAIVRRGTDVLSGRSVTFMSDNPDALVADRTRVASTDGAGQTATRSLPAGTIDASTVDPLTGLVEHRSVTLIADAPLTITIALLDQRVRVYGTVFARDGATPVPAATVALSGVTGVTSTDSQGRYAFDGVLIGPHQLSTYFSSGSGSASVSSDLEVVAPETRYDVALSLAVLRGNVTETGDPTGVAGVAVEACGTLYLQFYPYVQTDCVATQTNAEGQYEFLGLPAWGLSSGFPYDTNVGVTASIPDAPWIASTKGFVFNAYGTTTKQIDLALPETANLAGVVLDDTTLVNGAVVSVTNGAWTSPPLTAVDGHFAIARVPAGDLRVYAEDPVDGIPGALMLTVARHESADVEVHLLPSATLSGVRADENGGAAPGAVRVSALDAPTRQAGQAWTVTVPAEGPQATFNRRIPAGAWRAVVGFENCPDSAPVGAAEGSAAAGESAFAEPRLGTHVCYDFGLGSNFMDLRVPGAEPYPPYASESEQGRLLRGLRVRSGTVDVRTQQFTPATGDFQRTLTSFTNTGATPAQVSFDVKLTFVDGLRDVEGSSDCDASFGPADSWVWFTDRSGIDNGEEVAIVVGDRLSSLSQELDPGEVRSGEGGDYVIPGRLAARYSLEVPPGEIRSFLAYTFKRPFQDDPTPFAQALATLSVPEALDGLTEAERNSIVNFTVGGAPLISGTVTDGGQGVPNAHVGAITAEGMVAGDADSDGSGAFSLNLWPGTYTLVAFDGANRPGRRVVTVAGPADVGTIELLAPATVGTVTVVASGPVSYSGMPVELTAQGYSPVWHAAGTLDGASQAVFANVPPTLVTALTELGVRNGALTAGGTLTLTIQIGTGQAAVTGRVREASGQNVDGARVALVDRNQDPPTVIEVATRSNGTFLFSGVAQGTYDLVAVEQSSNRSTFTQVDVPEAGLVDAGTLTLPEPASVGSVVVHGVVEGNGAPATGAVVRLSINGCCQPVWPGSVVLDGSGTATVAGIPEGHVVAESGEPPDYGWEDGDLLAAGTLDLTMHIGGRVHSAIGLTGDDGFQYTVGGYGAAALSDIAWATYADGFNSRGDARLVQDGREAVIGPRSPWPGIVVERRTFVPPSGRFARLLDVIENMTDAVLEIPYTTREFFDTRPGNLLDVTTTSTGDLEFTSDDTYAVFARNDAAAPTLAAVLHGQDPGSQLPVLTWVASDDWTRYWATSWSPLQVPAHGRVMLMQFALQRGHDQVLEAEAQAQALADLSDPEALTGLTPAERAAVVNFAVPPSQVITGTVMDGGLPAANAHVGAIGASGLIAGATDADGAGVFSLVLGDGTYTFVAVDPASNRPGRVAVTIDGGVPTVSTIDLLAPATVGTVKVIVTGPGPHEGAPVEVRAQGYSPVWHASGALDAGAQATIVNVPPELITAMTAEGTSSGVLDPAGALTLTIAVPNASVSGIVREADDSPAAGVRVALIDNGQSPAAIVAEFPTTGADGHFTLAGVPTGNFTLAALEPSTNRVVSAAIEVPPGAGSVDAGTLVLPDPAQVGTLQIHGTLEGAANAPAANVVVRLPYCLPPLWACTAVLDSAGNATVRGLPPGYVSIEAGTPPDYGWEDGVLSAGNTLALGLRIGERVRLPYSIAADDGFSYEVTESGETTLAQDAWAWTSTASDQFSWRQDARLSQSGRELIIGPRTLPSGAIVHRRVLVPSSGHVVRMLDVIENPSPTPIQVEYSTRQYLVPTWNVSATESGDQSFTHADAWAVWANPLPETPTLGAVLRGAGNLSQTYEAFEWQETEWNTWRSTWSALEVPAINVAGGGRVLLMQLFVRRGHDEGAETQSLVETLLAPEGDVLAGLTAADRAAIVNFVVTP